MSAAYITQPLNRWISNHMYLEYPRIFPPFFVSSSTKQPYCQVSDFDVVVTHVFGTVHDRFGSASHATVPSVFRTIYLYCTAEPAGSVTVPFQSGLLAV